MARRCAQVVLLHLVSQILQGPTCESCGRLIRRFASSHRANPNLITFRRFCGRKPDLTADPACFRFLWSHPPGRPWTDNFRGHCRFRPRLTARPAGRWAEAALSASPGRTTSGATAASAPASPPDPLGAGRRRRFPPAPVWVAEATAGSQRGCSGVRRAGDERARGDTRGGGHLTPSPATRTATASGEPAAWLAFVGTKKKPEYSCDSRGSQTRPPEQAGPRRAGERAGLPASPSVLCDALVAGNPRGRASIRDRVPRSHPRWTTEG
ncbi:uncharacterized protein [Bos taurus]|uniref:uncharacterized protein n=1 Tax=Bos taurus TaxID=9913 RepID=UPI0028CB1F9C|nr:uncharacterized protein LOC112447857 [Bos taurus]XP_059745525.1 uncharacterized protein LOC112447857 [Bos taurus]